jgi:ABC-2 type transport system permease protein
MKNNLRRSLKHRILFITTFLLPIILCCLFGLIRFDKVSLRIGILETQEEAGWEDQAELYRLLDQSEGVSYAVADAKSSNTDLMMGRFHLLLDFRNASSIEEVQIMSHQPEERQQILRQALLKMSKDKSPLNLTGYKAPGLSTTERSVTMVLSLFMVFATIHASAFIRDRASGIMVRYQSTGYHQSDYLLGYFFHTLLLTLVQVLLCISSLSLLQPGFTLSLTEVLLITSLIAIMSSIYAIAICTLSKSEVSANIMASSMAGIFAILGGTFVAVEAMPGILRVLSLVSPIRWVVELLQII